MPSPLDLYCINTSHERGRQEAREILSSYGLSAPVIDWVIGELRSLHEALADKKRADMINDLIDDDLLPTISRFRDDISRIQDQLEKKARFSGALRGRFI